MVKKFIYALIILSALIILVGNQVYQKDIDISQSKDIVNQKDIKNILVGFFNNKSMCRIIISSKDEYYFRLIILNYNQQKINKCTEDVIIKINQGFEKIKIEKNIIIKIQIENLKSIRKNSKNINELQYLNKEIINLVQLEKEIELSKINIVDFPARQIVHKTELYVQVLIIFVLILLILILKKRYLNNGRNNKKA